MATVFFFTIPKVGRGKGGQYFLTIPGVNRGWPQTFLTIAGWLSGLAHHLLPFQRQDSGTHHFFLPILGWTGGGHHFFKEFQGVGWTGDGNQIVLYHSMGWPEFRFYHSWVGRVCIIFSPFMGVGVDRVANIFFFYIGGKGTTFYHSCGEQRIFSLWSWWKGVATILRLPFRGDRSGPKAGFRRPGPESPGPARDGPGFY